MISRVSSHIPMRANRQNLVVTKLQVLLRPWTEQWQDTVYAALGTAQTTNLNWVKTVFLLSYLYIYTCVSIYAQREQGGCCIGLDICCATAQAGLRNPGLTPIIFGQGNTTVLSPQMKGKKSEGKGKQYKAVQGWATILLPWSMCSITQHWRIK